MTNLIVNTTKLFLLHSWQSAFACWTLLLVFFFHPSTLVAAEIKGVRLWQSPESTRVVFDLSSPVQYKLYPLESPERIVIDFSESNMPINLDSLNLAKSVVGKIRTASAGKNKSQTRVVLDLKRKMRPNSFALEPFKQYGHRLVIDLFELNKKLPEKSRPKKQLVNKKRDIVVAIDPGHGGEDPGAIGATGTHEKIITLAVSKRLKKLIDKEPGMRAVLTRTGDYFIRLRKRQEIARKHKADLFVSIHADSFPDKRAKGASVWVVSNKGARSEVGRWLEQKESASDLLGGVEQISDKDPVLAELLLELSMDYSVGESFGVAQSVIKSMAPYVYKVHRKTVQEAGFVVLKAPDITSILIEGAFISNPKEEKLLKTASYQQKLAKGIFKGIKQYYRVNPPEGTLYAELVKSRGKQHTIQKGETLSHLAKKFGTTVNAIRDENRLKNDRVFEGQTITIP
ncbi:MAG: N-acetylmuramoyl-L-alanine amidase [Pseudomonadota bacterium]